MSSFVWLAAVAVGTVIAGALYFVPPGEPRIYVAVGLMAANITLLSLYLVSSYRLRRTVRDFHDALTRAGREKANKV